MDKLLIDLGKKASGRGLAIVVGMAESNLSTMKARQIWADSMTLAEAAHAIVKHLGKRAAGLVSEEGLDLVQERAALAREQRIQTEMKNAELRGELVRAEEIRRALFTVARSARNGLLTIPDRLATTLAGETDAHKIHQLMEREIENVLEEIAQAGLDAMPEVHADADAGAD